LILNGHLFAHQLTRLGREYQFEPFLDTV